MATRLDSVEARNKLKPRATTYWQRLRAGLAVGYRKVGAAGGAWMVQAYDPATRSQTRRSLGTFEELPAAQRFDAARKAAELLADHLGQGGQADAVSVAQACAAYVEHLRAEGRHATADDAQARFVRWVHSDKLAKLDLRKLAAHHVQAWRRTLRAAPVVINPHASADEQRTRERAPASINRDMATLRAALNLARRAGAVTTDAAWSQALAPLAGATRRRDLYLDAAQRRALIAHAPPDPALFVRGLALLPLRPGALAALPAGDFDRHKSTLRVPADKAGAGRVIPLPATTAAFVAEQARDKLPGAPLFARADGKRWDKDSWKKPIKAAALAASLPAATTAYTLRHGTITDLIGAGADVLLVARLSGTSLPMVEKHYGHLRGAHAAAALATLAL